MASIGTSTVTRRRFLQAAGYSATAMALHGQNPAGANEQVRLGLIGCGGRGRSLAAQFSGLGRVRIVAVSDPDTKHMDAATASLAKKKGGKPEQHRDYRKLPERMQSFGGRFGWNDGGESANMQTAWFAINKVPVVFEVNNMWQTPEKNAAVSYKSLRVGIIVTCEDGEFRGGRGGGYILGPDGKTKIEKFPGDSGRNHAQNFIDAVRSRRTEDLRAPIGQAHRSASLAHLANISLRSGTPHPGGKLREALPNHKELQEIVDRQEQQLGAWKVDTTATPYSLGPVVTVDPKTNTVLGPEAAAKLFKGPYRKEFPVPTIG